MIMSLGDNPTSSFIISSSILSLVIVKLSITSSCNISSPIFSFLSSLDNILICNRGYLSFIPSIHFVPDDDSIYSNKMYDRCELLSKIIYEILNIYNPLAVAYESAFLNSKYANAVIQLTQYTATLDRTIRYYDTFTKIFHYAPMMIKKKVGAGGGANKNDMLDNAKTIPILKEKLKLEELSEHEIDAASIGYVLYNDILTQPWLLYVI